MASPTNENGVDNRHNQDYQWPWIHPYQHSVYPNYPNKFFAPSSAQADVVNVGFGPLDQLYPWAHHPSHGFVNGPQQLRAPGLKCFQPSVVGGEISGHSPLSSPLPRWTDARSPTPLPSWNSIASSLITELLQQRRDGYGPGEPGAVSQPSPPMQLRNCDVRWTDENSCSPKFVEGGQTLAHSPDSSGDTTFETIRKAEQVDSEKRIDSYKMAVRSRRSRIAFSNGQLEELERKFRENPFIRQDRAELAQKLGITESQVKVWFQNRRMKERKRQVNGMGLSKMFTAQECVTRDPPTSSQASINLCLARDVP